MSVNLNFLKKTKSEQFFFVNQRFIKSPYLNHAINAAFEGLLKDGYHPSYFLNLTVDPKTIDINIHPTKTEIKFDDEHTLYAILRSAVKHSLGQFNIAPVLDFEHQSSLNTPYNYKDKKASTPAIEVIVVLILLLKILMEENIKRVIIQDLNQHQLHLGKVCMLD